MFSLCFICEMNLTEETPHIVVIGAGRSTPSLIDYLLEQATANHWKISILDQDVSLASSHINGQENAQAASLDVKNESELDRWIQESTVVVSMLPAFMHPIVAKKCINFKKHMVTASYITDEMQALNDDAVANGVILMNEIGVDPGIDHMSAMQVLDRLRGEGAKMLQFESFTGGLVAPESDDNPWNYKFTWNPRNVVLAGQGGAVKFIQQGKYKYIPYHRVFRRTEYMNIEGYGKFEGYANRDSLKYRHVYDLDDIPTIYRGTLRRPGFCRAWDVFVQLGATDDSYVIRDLDKMSKRDFINLFLAYNPSDSVELKLMHYLHIPQDDVLMEKLRWLGIFEDEPIGISEGTPAQVLEHILMDKWKMAPGDKDMIVMYHKFGYELNGEQKQIESSMVCTGDGKRHTAMAKTVGLPVAIAVKMIIEGKIHTPGVHLPINAEVYEPVLKELTDYGIHFSEVEGEFKGY